MERRAGRPGDAAPVSRHHHDDAADPELHLQPHPEARYELVDEVLAVTKRANVQAMGFVGNEAYANF